MNTALEAAVVALVVVTTALGTGLALWALPTGMPAGLRRIARRCSAALGAGLGSVLVLGVLVHDSGLDTTRTLTIEALLGVTLAGMVAEHVAVSRWLRTRWLCTPGAVLPEPVVLLPLLRALPRRVLRAAAR